MEDTLRAYNYGKEECYRGLNPCFNGRYSQSHQPRFDEKALPVLILVLMEDTLRVQVFDKRSSECES